MKVLDMFDDTSENWDKKLSERDREEANNSAEKTSEPKKDTSNGDSRDQYFDPELQRTISYAQSHYPSYKDPQIAFDKWVQRSINHSEERDLEHDEEIENLYRKMNQIATDLNKLKKQGVAEGADNSFRMSTSNSNVTPELRGVSIPGNMKHPEWREPTWSFAEVAEKLGVTPKELHRLALSLGNFPKKSEGLKSSYGSKAYYPRSEIKRWVNTSGIRDIIKSKQGVTEGSEQVFKVVAVPRSNALEKPTTINVKASSLDEVFERLAINDWYPLEINGVEVIKGKRLKQDLAEAKDLSAKISALEKKINEKQGSLEMAREKRKMSGKSKGVQSDREVKLGAEISKLSQELHILKNSQKDLVEGKDSFGYPSYTIEQLQRMFRNGTWEPMSDLKPNSHVQIRNTTTGGRKTVHVKPNDTKQFEDKSAKVEAWGYMYNNQDRRIVWRKVFPSGEAAYRWADQRNATVLGTRETEDSNTEPRKPLFKESTVSIKRTAKMNTAGERSQQYQLLDALGRDIAVFEDAQQAKHIYSTLQKLREALEISNTNPTDRVTMDIPLLLRVLEFAKEDAKTDMDLHDVTENLIDLSKSGQPLSMKDYENIVNIPEREQTTNNDQINEVGDRYWCKKERRWKDRS